MFNFENLETWHEAISFADLVYILTRRFPDEERFALPIRCGALRSPSHRTSPKVAPDLPAWITRFVEIATGSVFEVVSQATIVKFPRNGGQGALNLFSMVLQSSGFYGTGNSLKIFCTIVSLVFSSASAS